MIHKDGVIQGIRDGLSNSQIGKRLGISSNSVEKTIHVLKERDEYPADLPQSEERRRRGNDQKWQREEVRTAVIEGSRRIAKLRNPTYIENRRRAGKKGASVTHSKNREQRIFPI